jgi:PAS domain S-box-containing protein
MTSPISGFSPPDTAQAPDVRISGQTLNPGRNSLPDALGLLMDVFDLLTLSDATRWVEVMQAICHFFQAEAAGLYLSDLPGSPLKLITEFNFPKSAPQMLGNNAVANNGAPIRPLVQVQIMDSRVTSWHKAAEDAGWQDILVYNLPRCAARLVLGYKTQAKKQMSSLGKVVLRLLALSVRNRQSHDEAVALEFEAKEHEHLIASGIDMIQEGVVLLDEDGKVVTCNALGGKLLEYTPAEIVGQPAQDILASRNDIEAMIQRVLSGQGTLEKQELTLFQRYGDPLHVRIRIVPLRLPDKSKPFGAMVLFVDRQSEPMEALEKNLREENARLERMMSILAHEIRNPLAGIKAGLDYLRPSLEHDDEAVDDLEMIKGEIGRLDRLLHDALLVSRSVELKTWPQSITELLDDLLARREKLMQDRSISLHRQYEDPLPKTAIDRPQMEQVLENLIINAIQAMPKGGHLAVKVNVETEDLGEGIKSKPMLQIRICDTGKGIPPEMQARIFDPFFTTKKGGTGLGLAVARRIVGLHNGKLQVESWSGTGTIFKIMLPIEETTNG